MSSRLNQIQNWPELAPQAKWSALALAKLCGVSRRTLERHFQAKMGSSPKAWLVKQRRELAVKFLRNGSTVKKTACCLNYKHQNHLTNDFKKYWGACPTKLLIPKPSKMPPAVADL